MEFKSISLNQFAQLHKQAKDITRKTCGSFILFSGRLNKQPLIIGQDTSGNCFKVTQR